MTDALPHVWSARSLRQDREPSSLFGRLGYYSFDSGTPITSGTWAGALTAANVALTGQKILREIPDEPAVFALTRPPGHHAARGVYGGYCYLNNAAIAAQALRAGGAERVAILDVDYHHGNGTQSIFYEREDVFFVSLHADPAQAYPYFSGYADEEGDGPGRGCTLNIPLPEGTDWSSYEDALVSRVLPRVREVRPDYLVVSLGVDTYRGDPISKFMFETDDFALLGRRLASLGVRALFVMEGGYATDAVGTNVTNTLRGFEEAWRPLAP